MNECPQLIMRNAFRPVVSQIRYAHIQDYLAPGVTTRPSGPVRRKNEKTIPIETMVNGETLAKRVEEELSKLRKAEPCFKVATHGFDGKSLKVHAKYGTRSKYSMHFKKLDRFHRESAFQNRF